MLADVAHSRASTDMDSARGSPEALMDGTDDKPNSVAYGNGLFVAVSWTGAERLRLTNAVILGTLVVAVIGPSF